MRQGYAECKSIEKDQRELVCYIHCNIEIQQQGKQRSVTPRRELYQID